MPCSTRGWFQRSSLRPNLAIQSAAPSSTTALGRAPPIDVARRRSSSARTPTDPAGARLPATIASAARWSPARSSVRLKRRRAIRRRNVETEAQRAGAIVGALQKIVELAQLPGPGVPVDHAPPPVVRHRIPDRAEESPHAGRFADTAREAQLDRVELDGIVALTVRAAVHELAHPPRLSRRTSGSGPRSRTRLRPGGRCRRSTRAQKSSLNVFGLRAILGPRARSRVLPSSSRSGSATSHI